MALEVRKVNDQNVTERRPRSGENTYMMGTFTVGNLGRHDLDYVRVRTYGVPGNLYTLAGDYPTSANGEPLPGFNPKVEWTESVSVKDTSPEGVQAAAAGFGGRVLGLIAQSQEATVDV